MLVAVDTGGTKTLVARFDAAGTIAESVKFPTPPDTAGYFEAMITAIHQIADGEPVDTISIALPGTVVDDIVVWCFNLKWRNVDVKPPLQAAFPGVNVLIQNDASLAGLGETRMRQPVPQSSLYVTFSTGVGTGVTTDGHISPHFAASEGGQAIIEYNGKFVSWESIASGRTLYETYGQYARDITDEAIWRDAADRMSRGLLVLIPFMRPDVIIVGGSLGTYFNRYGHFLIDILRERTHNEIKFPEIVAAHNPEEAVIYGCYFYALDAGFITPTTR